MRNSFRALTEHGGSCLSAEGKKVSLRRGTSGHLCREKITFTCIHIAVNI